MSYTGASPVLGRGTATAGQIDRWFAQRGPAYAPQYAPDGQYLAPPPLGASIVAISRTLGVNADLVAAQILHETAAWQSRYARERNNPGGLGAINSNPDLAITFASPAAGIRAHISHLCTYVRGEGAWTADDPRYSATPVAWRGSVTTLSELDGKWAYPGVGYGAGIARLANDLLTTEVPMTAQIPGFQWVPETCGEYGYPQGTHGRNGVTIDRLILHCTIGTDSLGWLVGGNGNSVHFLDNRDGTPRAQMVLLEDAAWGAGNRAYNLRGVNYEHECTGAEMRNPAYWTDAIIGNMARNCAAILRHPLCAGILPDREHVIGHGEVPDQDHTDPGPAFPWDRFLAALVGELNGADDALYLTYPDGTRCPYPIVLGFRAWCEAQGRARGVADLNAAILSVTGYPQGAEYVATDGRTYQRFERLTLQYSASSAPPFDVVPILCGTALPPEAA